MPRVDSKEVTIDDITLRYELAEAQGDEPIKRICRRAMLGKPISFLAATAIILSERGGAR